MIKWTKWGAFWLVTFVYFFARHQLGEGFLGPFWALFCEEGTCGVKRFSLLRLVEQVFASTEQILIGIVASAFLSTLVFAFVWNVWRRSKRKN